MFRMRIVLLLMILLSLNLQAKKIKFDVFIAPPNFGPFLYKPFYVNLRYPTAFIDYDPDKDIILIKGSLFHDASMLLVDTESVLLDEYSAYCKTLQIILEENKTPNQIYSNMANIKMQGAIAKLNKIKPNRLKANLFYDKISRKAYFNTGARFYKGSLSLKHVDDMLVMRKFQNRVLGRRTPLTDDVLYEYLNYSNYQHEHCTDIYTLLLIQIPKKDINLTHIRFLYETLIDNNLSYIRSKFEAGKLFVKTKLTSVYVEPNKKKRFTQFFRRNLNKNVSGPYIKKHTVVFIKVLRKEKFFYPGDIDYKIMYCFVKKNISDYITNVKGDDVIGYMKAKKIADRLNKKKKMADICNETWITDNKLFSLNIRNNIVGLEKNNVSIIEGATGFHVVKILEKFFTKGAISRLKIMPIYRKEYVGVLLEDYLKTIKKQSYKASFYDRNHFDEVYEKIRPKFSHGRKY